MVEEHVIAALIGAVQGILEWIPVSSEAGVALALTALGRTPDAAVRSALVLHAGTALAALAYYREPVRTGLARAAGGELSLTARFVVVATLAAGVVGVAAFAVLEEALATLVAGGPGRAGGLFVALVGVALVMTGLLQRVAGWGSDDRSEPASRPDGGGPPTVAVSETDASAGVSGDRESPTLVDAILVGCLQGLAVIPGISRSGVTVGALLLRGYEGPTAFQLSFLLAIPASIGAAGLALADGTTVAVTTPTLVALGAAAMVGYVTIGTLLRVARTLPFWAICVVLGGLAVVGGLLVV